MRIYTPTHMYTNIHMTYCHQPQLTPRRPSPHSAAHNATLPLLLTPHPLRSGGRTVNRVPGDPINTPPSVSRGCPCDLPLFVPRVPAPQGVTCWHPDPGFPLRTRRGTQEGPPRRGLPSAVPVNINICVPGTLRMGRWRGLEGFGWGWGPLEGESRHGPGTKTPFIPPE